MVVAHVTDIIGMCGEAEYINLGETHEGIRCIVMICRVTTTDIVFFGHNLFFHA